MIIVDNSKATEISNCWGRKLIETDRMWRGIGVATCLLAVCFNWVAFVVVRASGTVMVVRLVVSGFCGLQQILCNRQLY